jgi:hypothetical protein
MSFSVTEPAPVPSNATRWKPAHPSTPLPEGIRSTSGKEEEEEEVVSPPPQTFVQSEEWIKTHSPHINVSPGYTFFSEPSSGCLFCNQSPHLQSCPYVEAKMRAEKEKEALRQQKPPQGEKKNPSAPCAWCLESPCSCVKNFTAVHKDEKGNVQVPTSWVTRVLQWLARTFPNCARFFFVLYVWSWLFTITGPLAYFFAYYFGLAFAPVFAVVFGELVPNPILAILCNIVVSSTYFGFFGRFLASVQFYPPRLLQLWEGFWDKLYNKDVLVKKDIKREQAWPILRNSFFHLSVLSGHFGVVGTICYICGSPVLGYVSIVHISAYSVIRLWKYYQSPEAKAHQNSSRALAWIALNLAIVLASVGTFLYLLRRLFPAKKKVSFDLEPEGHSKKLRELQQRMRAHNKWVAGDPIGTVKLDTTKPLPKGSEMPSTPEFDKLFSQIASGKEHQGLGYDADSGMTFF